MMKRIVLSLLAAVFGSSFSAYALDATAVKMEFTSKPAPKVEALKNPTSPFSFPGRFELKSGTWQVINLMMEYEAGAKSKSGEREAPTSIDRVDFRVHCLFSTDEGKSVRVTKDLSYADIPVTGTGEVGKGKFMVGVFISPADAQRINGSNKTALKLQAVAVEPTFKGRSCLKGSPDIVMSADLKSKLGKRWWSTKADGNSRGAELSAISETPFAPYYYLQYPPTIPVYGAPLAGASSSSTLSTTDIPDVTEETTTTTPDTETETPATDETAADETAAEETPVEADEEEGSKPRKSTRKKSTRKSSRSSR